MKPLLSGVLAVTLGACAKPQPEAPLPEKPETELPLEEPKEPTKVPPSAPLLPWAADTFSPRPASPEDPELDDVVRQCGAGDQSLHEVAEWVAHAQAERGEVPSLDEVRFHLRRRGAPYVMPRLWSAEAPAGRLTELEPHVTAWAHKRPPLGTFRCGAGSATVQGGQKIVSVVQVDVQAEMMPLRTRLEQGGTLRFQAKLDTDATAATLVLLPPQGRPHSVTPTIEHGGVSAKLSLPAEGTWLVQLMATQVGGPRPVAEALVTVGGPPPNAPAEEPVPGESDLDPGLPPADALFSMMNAARKAEGLPALKRNRDLDALAQKHSEDMRGSGRISHDLGGGDPAVRISEAGIPLVAAGENVAHAQSVIRLHRVLWASPSHRENLLQRRWEEAGVGIAVTSDGDFYATQLFVDK